MHLVWSTILLIIYGALKSDAKRIRDWAQIELAKWAWQKWRKARLGRRGPYLAGLPGGPVRRLPRVETRPSFESINELIFEVTQESDGGFVAEALGESIFTQADTWDELRANVREAVTASYFDRPAPTRVRLHLVRDEVLA